MELLRSAKLIPIAYVKFVFTRSKWLEDALFQLTELKRSWSLNLLHHTLTSISIELSRVQPLQRESIRASFFDLVFVVVQLSHALDFSENNIVT